jgi:hypothetical protein
MKRLAVSSLSPAALLFALALVLSGCDQPKTSCASGVGGFAAKYTLKPGQEACPDHKGKLLQGEILGLSKYNPLKEGEDDVQDLTKASLVIRSQTLGDINVDPALKDEAHEPYSLGDFVSVEPDDDDVCSVPELSVAEQDVPAMGASPGIHIKYEWSNVRLIVTAAYPGTQMVGDLTYTNNGCTASYSVIGLWPAVSCAGKDAQGNAVADPALCDPVADPEAGRATGSGINPDLKDRVACDPDILLCVLTAPPDALK